MFLSAPSELVVSGEGSEVGGDHVTRLGQHGRSLKQKEEVVPGGFTASC